jgi:hypothetical protein
MGRILESVGRQLVLPGGSIDAAGAYVAPLIATGGALAVAANTINQALTVAASGRFAYMTDMLIVVTATAAVAGTIALQDSSGGTVLWGIGFGATGPTIGAVIPVRFTNPPRNLTAGGQFFLSTTGAGVTYTVSCNGYYDNSLGN